jgi:chromosome transmission fidelity protein 1
MNCILCVDVFARFCVVFGKEKRNKEMQQQTTIKNFSFPYEAYPIQKDFMQQLYNAIDTNKIGIFESPTGTGKSLSIICSALTWLLEHSNNEQEGITHEKSGNAQKRSRESTDNNTNAEDDDDEPAWIKEQEKQLKLENEKERILREREKQEQRKDRVDTYQRKRQKFLHDALAGVTADKKKKDKNNTENDEDGDLLLADYDEDESGNSSASSILKNLNIGIKGSLLDDLFSSDEEDEISSKPKKKYKSSIFAEDEVGDENAETYETPKIIYCSRTHSQLAQFVQEIQKTEFSEKIRLVSLASRKQMCIHPTVSKIQSQSRVNEVCLDMKSKKDKKHKCPYDDQSGMKLFKDHVLIKVRDIEDLISLGKRVEACSYYGSRKAIPHAQVITLPYTSLIHQPTRETLGIKLEECVVIIDEAHNLVDAIVHTHSFQVTQLQVSQTQAQLIAYFEKYKNRLKAKNQARVKQLLSIMDNMTKFLKNGINSNTFATKDENTTDQILSEVLSLNEFSFRTNTDNINMFHVCEFIEKSELTKKLNGFIDRKSKDQPSVTVHKRGGEQEESIESGVHAFTSFLLALTNISKDGKIMIQINKTNPSKSLIKFVLLNPSVYFKEVVDNAKSVILAGGTMEPISAVIQQLFPEHKPRIKIFQCGHVIPDENILPICLTTAPSTKVFDFTYQSRSLPTTVSIVTYQRITAH